MRQKMVQHAWMLFLFEIWVTFYLSSWVVRKVAAFMKDISKNQAWSISCARNVSTHFEVLRILEVLRTSATNYEKIYSIIQRESVEERERSMLFS